MAAVQIVDVVDEEGFVLVPPCADPSFDHRTCDYWEDGRIGSKAARPSWLQRPADTSPPSHQADQPYNPFLADATSFDRPSYNPFAAGTADAESPFAAAANSFQPESNPFSPAPRAPKVESGGLRKLSLLQRGMAVFGSYAKVLLVEGRPAAYVQFGPLSAYPRALSLRDLYPQLPSSPLPAVVTCIATTLEGRRKGHARRLIDEVCHDLGARGFAAVEAYPERGAEADRTSGGSVELWQACGFVVAVDDARFPVMRRELG